VNPEDRRARPAWVDSTANVVFLIAATAMWAYYMVRALSRGAYALGVLDGLLVIASVWTITRIIRRRPDTWRQARPKQFRYSQSPL
jgi:hypothetical protein